MQVYLKEIFMKLFLLEYLLEFKEFNNSFKNISMANNHAEELIQMKQLKQLLLKAIRQMKFKIFFFWVFHFFD
jgi:hypothetical protein